jgi:hypothetical protein
LVKNKKYKIKESKAYQSKRMMQNVNREIEKMMKNAIVALASKYNFDADEGMRMIWESEGLISSSRSRNKKVSNKKEKREVVKSAFPLPYNGELNGECCFGIRQNSGLYTQCPSIRPEGGAYCGSCNKQATKNEHGLPDYGSIQTRSSKYLKDEEFVDPSGKKPVSYTKIMKKLKLTEEQVREEAAKHNITLDPRHFVEVEKKSGRPAKEPKEPLAEQKQKAKGRPKKSKKVLELAGEEEDLFASLVMAANKTVEDIIEETVTSESEADDNSSLGDVDVVVDAKPSKTKTEKKPKVSPEEKAALAEQKKQALAEQKKQEAEQKKQALAEQKKLEAEQKKLLAKQEAEQKKQALAEQKKLEAEQKKLALEKEKEAKKFLKELEKQEKQAIAEIKKENKEKKETKKETKKESKVEAEEEADVVKKIDFEGKKYLKSKKTGIIYNMDQEVIGKWNESKQRIDFNETGEESEEDYDEDDN